jgi:phytoene dehydrogenase-like protein
MALSMKKRVVVIGAGIAGLTAAVYAQRSGFDVTLIEQHNIVGGMCTSWKRKGYLFEGAVHWLTGSNPRTDVYQIWKDTGALNESIPIFLHDPFRSIEHNDRLIHLYRDIDKTAAGFLAISPNDKKQIRQLVKDVKRLCSMQMPIFDIRGLKAENPKKMSLRLLLNMLPAFPVVKKLGKITCQNYVQRFHNPGIRRILRIVPGEYSATSLLFTLATLHTRDGGCPEGGSLPMVHRMKKTFTDLGGNLMLGTHVKKVIIENDKVKGVTLESGILRTDAVIVTQETIAAYDMLFDTPLRDEWLKELCENTSPAVCTFICVGVRAELPDDVIPDWELDTPIEYAGRMVNELGFNSYRRYAPGGGTALTTVLMGDTYEFWRNAKKVGSYEEEKRLLADQISRALCGKYPECAGKIEVIDIATPLTYERYTGAYHGSWMSILEPGKKMRQYSGVSESVDGLYFAGHRIMSPGGLPASAASGRQAAQHVCKQFDVVFR